VRMFSVVNTSLRSLAVVSFMTGLLMISHGCDSYSIAPSLCEPSSGTVARVIDGDTVELVSGEKVRFLLVNTPELSSNDCFATQAQELTERLLLGQEVDLKYDAEQQTQCFDQFDRLLAYIYLDGHMINQLLLERGYGELLVIEQAGRKSDYRHLAVLTEAEQFAKANNAGLWGSCQ